MNNVLVSCDHGLFVVNRFDGDSNTYAGQGEWLLYHGNSCIIEAAIVDNNITKDDPVIFDIGSNIGSFTSLMCKRYPNGIIYAFEPQRLIFQMACGNMALNNFNNVYLYNIGLGKENKSIEIHEPDYSKRRDYGTFSLVNDMKFDTSKFTSVIDVVTLDWFVEKYGINVIDFLKIDAEGMDIDVLIGARRAINKFKPTILVEHINPSGSLYDELVNELNGYSLLEVNNNILAKYE